ncbi:IS66 family transposase [Enterococcus faecium]|uniref:IS66 family transposase n=1 Tax=Enterococcus faecium TaxID=1352 RepID=UPI00349F2AF6
MIESAKTDAYYWQFCTGKGQSASHRLLSPRRKSCWNVPKTFLKEFTGYLHCDGYSEQCRGKFMRLVYCFAHVRRKFFETIPRKEKHGYSRSSSSQTIG